MSRFLPRILVACAVFTGGVRLNAQTTAPPIGVARVAGQVTVGTLLIPIGFVAGGLISRQVARTFGASETTASAVARAGAGTGSALLGAAGVAAIGSRGAATGSYLASLGGAVGGGLASYALVRLNKRHSLDEGWRCGPLCRASVVAIALLPATGATFAYNASRRRE